MTIYNELFKMHGVMDLISKVALWLPSLFFAVILTVCFFSIGLQITLAYIEFYIAMVTSYATFFLSGLKQTRKYAAKGINAIFAVSIKLMFFCMFSLMLQMMLKNIVVEDFYTIGGETSKIEIETSGAITSIDQLMAHIREVESSNRYYVDNGLGYFVTSEDRMYFLRKDGNVPSQYKHYTLIGCRPDGKWVKYFDTEDLCKQYLGNSKNVSIKRIILKGDTIIANYARSTNPSKAMAGYFHEKEADEFGEFRFKWDESAKWFGVEKITYNQTPTEQKPTQENKPETNQPMRFSQPVKIGHAGHYKDTDSGGFFFEGTSYNNGDIISGSKTYGKGLARWGKDKDSLYCEYDSYLSSTRNDRLKFGGKNNFVVQETTGRDILKIESNKGITIYVLYRQFMYFAYLDIIGCRQDGTWVKYVDFKQLEKQFFEDLSKKYMIDLAYGNHGNKLEYYYNGNFVSTKGDTVIVIYSLWKGWERLQKGEFRFKWDESAQWFGVEKIVY